MRLIPYITVSDAARAIEFYCSALGARETGARFTEPGGKVGHAEISFDDWQGDRLLASRQFGISEWPVLAGCHPFLRRNEAAVAG